MKLNILILTVSIFALNRLNALPFVYVCNNQANSISVIDVALNMVVATIPIPGAHPQYIAITPDDVAAYVTCAGDSTVKIINLSTNMIVGSLSIPNPFDIAITPNGNTAYVTGSSTMITPIDITNRFSPTSHSSVTSVDGASHIAVAPDGSFAYVTTGDSGAVPLDISMPLTPIVGATITFTNSANNEFIAITPDSHNGYVTCQSGDNRTYPFSIPANMVGIPPSPYHPSNGIAVAPNGLNAYFVSNPSGVLHLFESLDITNPQMPSIVASLSVAESLWAIAITPDGATAYVTDSSSNALAYAFNITNPSAPTLRTTIPVGNTPLGLAITHKTSITPPDPTNVTGTIRNNIFLDKTESILIINWTASAPSDDIVAYNIYRGSTLIGTVSANNSLCFRTLMSGCNTTFSVAAVDVNGAESEHVPVVIS